MFKKKIIYNYMGFLGYYYLYIDFLFPDHCPIIDLIFAFYVQFS